MFVDGLAIRKRVDALLAGETGDDVSIEAGEVLGTSRVDDGSGGGGMGEEMGE